MPDERELVLLAGVVAAVGLLGCSSTGEVVEPAGEAGGEEVALRLLQATDLGSGWSEHEADPTKALFVGWCNAPELLTEARLDGHVRYERGGVTQHFTFETEEDHRIVDEFADLANECAGQQRDETTVRSVRSVSFAVDGIPDTDTYRIVLDSQLFEDLSTEAVWAWTPVGDDRLSVLGANTSTLDEQPEDVMAALEDAARAVYR